MPARPTQLSIGKYWRLRQTASPHGTFSILAIDHRGPLLRQLKLQSQKDPESLAPSGSRWLEQLTLLKQDVVAALGPHASAVLLDPETSAAHCAASHALAPPTGLITALDTGSTGDPQDTRTGLIDGWSVDQATRLGAQGVKLLVYYHPAAPDAHQVEQTVAAVARESARLQIPFFLEPLACSPDAQRSPLPAPQRCEAILETLRRLVPLGVDVAKVEFPVPPQEVSCRQEWRAACEQLTAACAIPWVLLSGGADYETFLEMTRIACGAGASGVMAGRAVWKESVSTDPAVRDRFLTGVGVERMTRLRDLCDAYARPFTQIYAAPQIEPGWYL
jgi:tagatose 1,6-diphosphate aldolase